MTNLPLVSIVTPTYNQSGFIRDTIDSVLSQDYPNLEYIVVNDGSTDSTEDVLRSYGDRLRFETQPNHGQTAAINAGWRLSTGLVLAWLNSDDTLLPGAVSKVVRLVTADEAAGVVYGRSAFVDACGARLPQPPAGRPFDYLGLVGGCENPVPQPSAFLQRYVYESIGPLDRSLYYFMDWDYWLRAGLRHRFVYTDEILSTYRMHDESKTVAGLVRAAPELEIIYRRYFDRADLPSAIRKLRRKALANMYFTTAAYCLAGGEDRGARRAALLAARTSPRLLLTGRGLHKFAYGLLGRSVPYRTGRKIARAWASRW